MKKSDAVKLFGSQKAIAEALGVSRVTVCNWSDDLPLRAGDQVIGAAVRLGIIKGTLDAIDPEHFDGTEYGGLVVRY